MKHLILAICIIAAASLHADPTPSPSPAVITLPVTVPVQVTTIETQETDTVTPELVIINLNPPEIGVKFAGIESRQVVSGPAAESIIDEFWTDFAAAIVAALYPTPAPSPTPE